MPVRLGMLLLLALITPLSVRAEPLIKSWFTDATGRYASLYETVEDENSLNSVTTWSRGNGTQTLPTYSGVHEVSYTATDVYIRSTGLPFHTMGPWYINQMQTVDFPNFPSNREFIYRLSRTPSAQPATPVETGLGVIGFFVDGVALFDNRDAFSWNNANQGDSSPNTAYTGDEVWNRDAWVNEYFTLDSALGHQAGNTHHYHVHPPGLRHLMGDSVDFNQATNSYTENFNGKHSPILGWVSDGLPIYGPYGYSDPSDATSTVRRMVTGYQPRNLANGATRDSLPQWVTVLQGRSTTIAANVNGPNVSNAYPVGHYLEDYDYKGDLGMTLGTDFDLNLSNVRFCLTPEFPQGTWAYFTAIDGSGEPEFPYNLGRAYHGTPVGSQENSVPGGATVYWEGGAERPVKVQSISVDDSNGDVVLTWSSVAGGSYRIETSPDASAWIDLSAEIKADSPLASLTDGARAADQSLAYYKPRMDSVAPFDDAGFVYDNSAVQPAGTIITVYLTTGGSPPPPENLAILPTTFTFNGQPVTVISRLSQYAVQLEVDLASLPDGTYTVSATFPDSGAWTGEFNHVANPNVLLLIVDDWGIDASPIDNNTTLNPGTTFATMANLQLLAANGVRFTNAYAQPVCSPTRAALMTGRHAFRTGVGNAGDNLQASETTLPEAFTAAASPYQLASFGKWHLNNNVTGYSTVGGWPHFEGITGGGLPDYTAWQKNTNGVLSDETAYATTDQVDDAKAYIDARETADEPWFVWMGFTAPHDPFHDPPAELLQGGTGTDNKSRYQKALEALDTEIGRLLLSVDLNTTNIILVGDNGTPAQVVQAPFGPTGANGNSKGDLYEGGIHVPMVARGPSVQAPAGSTTDKLVHVVDLYSTILELANVPVPATAVDSNSIVPILSGNDTADRQVITEAFGVGAFGEPGRSLRLGAYPDYKLIIHGDPLDTQDVPEFKFYNIVTDQNEGSPIDVGTLTGDALLAYNAMVALDLELGGGYSDLPSGPEDTLYIQLPTGGGPASVPANMNIGPISITVDGVTASYSSRVDSTETADRYWVKCTVPQAASYTSATVTFTNNPNTGDARVFDSIQIIIAP